MTSNASESGVYLLRDAQDFSLVQGGPLFQLLMRTHLSSDALTLVVRRVIMFVLLSWVPLLVLSALGGHLLHTHVAVPFLLDLETHIRFLVVVPLLLDAELIVHRRLLWVTRTFLERNLIPAASMPRFDAAITSAFRLRNSVPAELLLIVFVYAVGVMFLWRHFIAIEAPTWYAVPSAEGS
jgi:hypothetical protein